MQITSTSSKQSGYFPNVKGFMTTCGSNCSNNILDYSASKIVQYDQNWTYISMSNIPSNPSAIISAFENGTRIFYLASGNGIYKLDSNFNIIGAYNYNLKYFSVICFNPATNHVLAISNSFTGVFIFDQNLSLIKYYEFFTNSFPTDIKVYNGVLYVSSSNGNIWILKNETVSTNFFTMCTNIYSILIDPFGFIAVECSTFEIYVYSTNGSYTSVSWMNLLNLVQAPLDIDFDSNGNIAVSGTNGVYLINTPIVNATKLTNATFDNSCINKSKTKILILLNFIYFFFSTR